MITLSRSYPSVLGAPSIDRVDERVFSLRYFAACMDCTFCTDRCCAYGSDIGTETMAALESLGADFESYCSVPREEWFTGEIVRDAEFPSGAHARTRVKDGFCVFLNRSGRGCRIHSWCLDNGLDYHVYKPMVGILFPVTFEYGALVPSNEMLDGSLICSGDGPTLYDGVRGELAYFFGEEFVTELDTLALPNR